MPSKIFVNIRTLAFCFSVRFIENEFRPCFQHGWSGFSFFKIQKSWKSVCQRDFWWHIAQRLGALRWWGNRSTNLQFCTKVEPKNYRWTLQFRPTIAKPLLATVPSNILLCRSIWFCINSIQGFVNYTSKCVSLIFWRI